VKIENEVQLAHAAEVLVEDLDEQVDGLKASELIVVYIHAQCKK
jgi:hypothetical protein